MLILVYIYITFEKTVLLLIFRIQFFHVKKSIQMKILPANVYSVL